MSYCSNTDLIARISQAVIIALTDDEKDATTSETLAAAIIANSNISARITAAIADADSEIDSWCRKQYDVPFETTPARITRCSATLTLYFLHCRRRSEMGIPDDVKELYKAELDYLRAVNKGEVDLGVEPAPAASSVVMSDADGEDRLFTEDTLEDF